ncbi:MAG: tetratricopeptide repeat protein [Pseudomonadota bacterium]|nr:tetratricopeptide repeat protein [Pseudomonadota bacterium]
MKNILPKATLSLALGALLSTLAAAPVVAQDGYGNAASQSLRAKRDAERAKQKQKEQGDVPEAPALFPNATRTQADAKASSTALKGLQELQAQYEQEDFAGVVAKADVLAASGDASPYEKAFAYQLAGNASADLQNDAKAAEYFQKALDSNGLDNNSHYQVMHNLSAVQFGLERYDDALKTLDRFLAETKTDDPKYQSFRGSVLASAGRNDDAAKLYADLLAKNPNDKKILMNAVASLQQADKFNEANALLGDAHKKGLLTEAREYRALYSGYLNADNKWKDAVPVINDGVAKGILAQDAELAKAYMIVAQNAYTADDMALAAEMYGKAGPIAADGEAWLNLAKVHEFQGKKAEAASAAQKALDKGVKKPEEARRLLLK